MVATTPGEKRTFLFLEGAAGDESPVEAPIVSGMLLGMLYVSSF